MNVAKFGKATQESMAYGGVARRAIDGDTSGQYGARYIALLGFFNILFELLLSLIIYALYE